MKHNGNRKLITAACLLLWVPVFVGFTWTYAYLTPHRYYAEIVFDIWWDLIDGDEFKSTLGELAQRHGAENVIVRSINSYSGPSPHVSTLFTVGVYHTNAEEAAAIVNRYYRHELNEGLNEAYFRRLSWMQVDIIRTPIRLWKEAEPALAPARTSILPTVMAGTLVGVFFTLAGLILIVRSSRSKSGIASQSSERRGISTPATALLCTASLALLLHFPASLGVAQTYATFAPREFYSEVAVKVDWRDVAEDRWKIGIRDLRWNHGWWGIKVRRLKEHDAPDGAVYAFGAYNANAAGAAEDATALYNWLWSRFNTTFSEADKEWRPVPGVSLFRIPLVPAAPALPDVTLVNRIGEIAGMLAALLGIPVLWKGLLPVRERFRLTTRN